MNGPAQAAPGILVLIAVVLVVAGLQAAQEVLIPLAIAILLTFLLAPISERLQRLGINHIIAVILTVAIAFAAIGALTLVVFNQFIDLVSQFPRYRLQLRQNLQDLAALFQGGVGETTRGIEELTEEIKAAAPANPARGEPEVPKVEVVEPEPGPAAALVAWFGPFLRPIGTAAIVVVFVIFMLLRVDDLRDRFIRLLGARNLRTTTAALDDAARRVSRFLLMHTLINGIQAVLVTIGLTLLGVPNAVLWGALTLVLRFIPYVGPWLAASMPVALSIAVFDNWYYPLLTAAMFVVLELNSNVVLEPWLYGAGTGVSPLALLVSAVFWTWLWGAPGLFLAIPLTVCLVVMGKYIPQLGFLHVLLSDEPGLEPHERLYQRLLARNREDADEVLEEALARQSPLEVCDSIIVPTAHLAERDHDQGLLDEGRRAYILAHLDEWADEELHSGAARGSAAVHLEVPDGAGAAPAEGQRVLCLPAADQADAVISKWLVAILRRHGMHAETRRPGGLRNEVAEWAAGMSPDVVVISALPPEAVVHARYLCKRLRSRLGGVPVIVGLWCAQGDMQRAVERLMAGGASRVVRRFDECLEQTRILTQPAIEARALASTT